MDSLLDLAVQSHPVIAGDRVIFVWSGDQPPQLIGDMTDWQWGSPIDLTEAAPGVWVHTLTLPQDAYLEYAFWDGQQRVADPLNGNRTPDGIGHENHFFYMPGARATELTQRRHGVPQGTITRHVIENDFFAGQPQAHGSPLPTAYR